MENCKIIITFYVSENWGEIDSSASTGRKYDLMIFYLPIPTDLI